MNSTARSVLPDSLAGVVVSHKRIRWNYLYLSLQKINAQTSELFCGNLNTAP